MNNEETTPKGFTRRNFIRGTALGAAAVASTGFLTGCGSDDTNQQTNSPESAAGQTASFETPPPAISDKDIKQTISTEVVVVGAGTGGMFAALSSAEAGAKTIVLEKGSVGAAGPGWMAAVNSSLQKKKGIKLDRNEVVAEVCRYAGHLVDQSLVNLWADKSGEVMDWFTPIAEAGGLKMMVETDIKEGYYKSFPVGHVAVSNEQATSFPTGGIGSVYYLPIMVNKAKEMGVEMLFETPLVQLIRKDKGRVTGVIAKNAKGEYMRINTSKGVILCTGGYARNEEMLKKLCPEALATSLNVAPPTNTGDGILAALWVGAAMDPIHAPMVFDRGLVIPGKEMGPPWQGGFLQLGSQPFLRVNVRGERFVNEDLPYDNCWDAALMQPDKSWWQVWDSNWKDDVKRFHATVCARIINDPNAPPRAGLEVVEANIEKLLKMKLVKKADTIEGLAKELNVPADTFKATVARYNELTKQGKDLDFGKIPFRMSTLENGPFYAANLAGLLICTLNGLRINTNLEVLDTDLNAIPGLYAAGNDSGSFFAFNYPELLGGLALGRTATFGRLAGLNAVKA
ncbi:MAG: FAD-dependent oxidoreductase [Bacillota bacterium]|nr:FAD-dependent oxidoreductase [Bacillota bacterium]